MCVGFNYSAILVMELVRLTKVKDNSFLILQMIQINT